MTEQQKEEYRKNVKAQIDAWESQVEKIGSKIEKSRSKADRMLKRQLKSAEKKRNELVKQFNHLKSAGDTAWEKTKEKVDEVLFKTRYAFDEITRRIKGDNEEG
jgi:recombinational DNA repair ATPase RecF